MKALETEYHGTKFRSRTEARWAIFFDQLRVAWDYEPEAYDLDGLFYLPDFWLPQQKIFVEIKPIEPTSEELEKARRLVQHTGLPAIIQTGNPVLKENGSGDDYPLKIFPEGGEDFPYIWCECARCGAVDMQFDGRSARIKCRCPKSSDKDYNYDSPRLVMAFEVARSHRFWTPAHA